jgi:RNA:NAD 2'-phosphotransferase (TPT1/KptA family)
MFDSVIHGTFKTNWDAICESTTPFLKRHSLSFFKNCKAKHGLSRMGRQHIHLAPGKFGEEGVISGTSAHNY